MGSDTSPTRSRPLGFAAVVALIFFGVSGGPFGIEDSVRHGGPRLALLGLILLPIIWGIPEALVTAELTTMFPEDSGYVAWVTAAFGPFWGFQEGFLSWISGVIDNSIYPIILARYLKWFFPVLQQGLPKTLFLIASSVGLSYLNYRGLKVVGSTAVVLTVFILLPFGVLAVASANEIDPENWWSDGDVSTRDLVSFVNVMFWNLNYWDSVASLSGEIGDVTATLPKAMMAAVLLVGLGYFLPILIGVGVLGAQNWPEGFFSYLGRQIGGAWMEGWIVLSAVASQVGLFTAELSSDAYLILGLAERGMLPKFLAQKSKHGTPTVALLLSCSGMIIMLTSFDIISAIEMLNAVYCVAELLEFAALIRLRMILPDFPRPFKIPLEIPGLCCMLFPSTFFAIAVLLTPLITLNMQLIVFISVTIAVSVVLYLALEHCKGNRWIQYYPFDLMIATATYHNITEQRETTDGAVLAISQLDNETVH